MTRSPGRHRDPGHRNQIDLESLVRRTTVIQAHTIQNEMSVFITQAGHGGQAHFNWKTKQQFLELPIGKWVDEQEHS